MLKRLVLGGNPWTCDQTFIDFIRLNKKKFVYECFDCNDVGPLCQKKNRLTFSITNDSQDRVKSTGIDSSERIHKLNHDEGHNRIQRFHMNLRLLISREF